MFTLWYSILSYKKYRDVIFAPLTTSPSISSTMPDSSTKPSAISLEPAPILPPAPSPALKIPVTPAPAPPEPRIRSPLSPPTVTKPPRLPSPHPMIRSDVLDDIDFEDESLSDEGEDEDEELSHAVAPPMAKPLGDAVNRFLQEEKRNGSAVQMK